MKHTRIIYSTLSLLLCLGMGLHTASAQKVFGVPVSQVRVNTVQESSSKAVYTFKAGNQEAKLTLTQSGATVGISIENQSCSLGSGKVNVKNGNLDFRTSDLHKGTLGIWVFASQLVNNVNNQAGLSPRQKAANKCRNYCKSKTNQPVIVQALAVFGGTGRQDPPVCVPADALAVATFDSALSDYANCFQDCMQKARDAYKNKK